MAKGNREHGARAPVLLNPQLSRDGRVVFEAAGYLWQELENGEARRLFSGSEIDAASSISPDRQQLMFVREEHRQNSLMLFDFASQHLRALASGADNRQPAWSPDGQRVVFVGEILGRSNPASKTGCPKSGEREKGATVGIRVISPGRLRFLGTTPAVCPRWQIDLLLRQAGRRWIIVPASLEPKSAPEAITRLTHHLSDGLVSPDGRWLAFRRNTEIWLAPFGAAPILDADTRRISPRRRLIYLRSCQFLRYLFNGWPHLASARVRWST